MRKKKPASHENHERWLVSYADFITLLFAFFVVMFASSQADKGRAKQVSDAIERALEQGTSSSVRAAVAKVLGGTVDDKGQGNAMMKGPGGAQRAAKNDPPPEIVELLPSVRALSKEFEEEIRAGKLEISLQPRGLVVSLREAAFFPSGEDVVDPDSYPIIAKLSKALNSISSPIRLEGHTDSVPIHTARFPSNWDLSAARSIAMLKTLTERFDVKEDRLAVAGYADRVPLGSNDTPEGRARNRRVDIVLLNRLSTLPETKAASGTSRHQ